MRPIKIIQSITSRDTASFEKYLLEISRIPMITPEEEIRLAREIRNGNREAISVLARSNLRFVVSVAKQYQNRGLPLVDLISEGNVGLLRAAENFDETRGFKFISYAVWWIRQSIIQSVNTKSRMVRLPENKVNLKNRIHGSIQQLEQELERAPSSEEIADHIRLNEQEVELIANFTVHHQSLDAPLGGEDGEVTLLDQLYTQERSPDSRLDHHGSLQNEIDRCLSTLSPIQNTIIRYFFGLGREEMRIGDIGTMLQLSAERVRQIKQKAIIQLRKEKKTDLLRPFLG